MLKTLNNIDRRKAEINFKINLNPNSISIKPNIWKLKKIAKPITIPPISLSFEVN